MHKSKSRRRVSSGSSSHMTARCMKCKSSVPILDPEVFTAKNGRQMTRGYCACGCKVCTTKV